jgi:Zn-dependent protease with chaperone function
MIKNKVKTSAKFKSEATKATLSILFFLLSYLLILMLAIGLAVACVVGGFLLITYNFNGFTIMFGLALAGMGLLVLFFLLKFIFTSDKTDTSHYRLLQQKEAPALFEMIAELVKTVGTDFPKKVYLSSEVNAFVFYNSSFWSMFFPVRKNLLIGMGLVNTVTTTELKSILAHEFGHFSQSSMKLGSYVYQVNRIIFNMLYENDSFDKVLNKWASFSGYFAFMVAISLKIIKGIQWILKQLYTVVNKSYMGLSREMEFHADAIAANATGYEPLCNSLLRIPMASLAFENVLNFYYSQNKRSQNYFPAQLYVLQWKAEQEKITLKDGLPQLFPDTRNLSTKAKLVYEDQWASHPSNEERIKRMVETGLSEVQHVEAPAIELFVDAIKIQEELTAQYESDPSAGYLEYEDFVSAFLDERANLALPQCYNGYYDGKNPSYFDLEEAGVSNLGAASDLFNPEKVDLINHLNTLKQNHFTLQGIQNKSLSAKTFDYDGKRYSQKASGSLLKKLENEIMELEQTICMHDKHIYDTFLALEKSTQPNPLLKQIYQDFFAFDLQYDKWYQIYAKLSDRLHFVHQTTPIETIKLNLSYVKDTEIQFKQCIAELMEVEDSSQICSEELAEQLNYYKGETFYYFKSEQYHEENLSILFGALNNFLYLLQNVFEIKRRRLLNYQASLMNNISEVA